MIQPAQAVHLAQRTVKRLDVSFKKLHEGSEERAQALLYAAFLSDVLSGAIPPNKGEVIDMLGMVEQFCQLVESRDD
ncbi:hypothetical protein B0G84_9047 [Paraburkholderia sp. BL8N3]|nr:hypothetical protein [Paraburkholderia sp. BL8N3]TCK31932.1 hypothetical protein B0G84_9047 [Paraburkholderia sp. BL8N3]